MAIYLNPCVRLQYERTFSNNINITNNKLFKDITCISFTRYLLVTDLHPCFNMTCQYHGLCKAFGPRDARCVCVDSCPSYQEPVCSSNGTTYDNECLYKQEMCVLQMNFSVHHPGSCESKNNN